MLDIDKLLGQLLGSSQGKTLAGGLIVGGLAGAMTGKTGKKVATTALKLGGAAAIAGLAYKAYQHYRSSQQSASAAPLSHANEPAAVAARNIAPRVSDEWDGPPPSDSGFLPPVRDRSATNALSSKLIHAMISVAKADGRIDAQESARIFRQVEDLGLNDEEKHFLISAVSTPWSVEQVAAAADSPEEAAEIFAASLLAANSNGAAEQEHLAKLAGLLNLDPALVQTIRKDAAVTA